MVVYSVHISVQCTSAVFLEGCILSAVIYSWAEVHVQKVSREGNN